MDSEPSCASEEPCGLRGDCPSQSLRFHTEGDHPKIRETTLPCRADETMTTWHSVCVWHAVGVNELSVPTSTGRYVRGLGIQRSVLRMKSKERPDVPGGKSPRLLGIWGRTPTGKHANITSGRIPQKETHTQNFYLILHLASSQFYSQVLVGPFGNLESRVEPEK